MNYKLKERKSWCGRGSVISGENGGDTEPSGGVGPGAGREDDEGLVGPTAVANEVAAVGRRRQRATEAPPRSPPRPARRSLPLPQSRVALRPPRPPLLHGPLRVRLQGSLDTQRKSVFDFFRLETVS